MKKVFLASLFLLVSTAFAAGELTVRVEKTTPSVVPLTAIGVPMLEVNLMAENETVYVEKLVFRRTGLSAAQDIKSLRATGTDFRSRSFSMLYDDTATIRFFRNLIIPAGTTQSLSITANLDIQGMGRTVNLELIEVVSSATQNNLREPFSSSQESTITTSSFSKNPLEVKKISSFTSRLHLGRWQKLEKFRLSNRNNKAATLEAMYLDHQGTGALPEVFENLVLTSSLKVVSKMGKLSSRSAEFEFLPNVTVGANSDRLLEVWGQVRRNKSTYSVDFNIEDDAIIVK